MKKILTWSFLFIIGLSILAGCSSDGNNATQDGSFTGSDLNIEYQGTTLSPNTLFDETIISETYDYYEAQSCGFVGLDKIYTYNDIEVYTYPNGDKDYVLELLLLNQTETSKGIKNGSTYDEIIKAYGSATSDDGTIVEYTNGTNSLIFTLTSDQIVEEIRYVYNY